MPQPAAYESQGASPTIEVSDDPDRKDLAARTDYTELVDILL